MRYKHAMQNGLWLLAAFFFFLPVSVKAEETALNTHVTPLFPESQVDESKGITSCYLRLVKKRP
ncbi:hypothetical protein IGI82_003675 [Enterococcus sp. AZ067]|uniref:hypothetical protein n=1 Tax=Enterococcus sp. AZ067 TaxID=2774674 RepID=UPI003F283B09